MPKNIKISNEILVDYNALEQAALAEVAKHTAELEAATVQY